LSQEAKEHIDNLVGGTFFLLKTQKAQALFEKITASEWGLALNHTSASEEHRVKQEFQV
jgi:hypothetical protein